MIKHLELSIPGSCLNKAADDEPVFVLRAKDPCATRAVAHWIDLRQIMGLDSCDSKKLAEARQWMMDANDWREANTTPGTSR